MSRVTLLLLNLSLFMIMMTQPSFSIQQTFGLEYDLSLFNIVAVDDFNMGAMENKSLNVFNSRWVCVCVRVVQLWHCFTALPC